MQSLLIEKDKLQTQLTTNEQSWLEDKKTLQAAFETERLEDSGKQLAEFDAAKQSWLDEKKEMLREFRSLVDKKNAMQTQFAEKEESWLEDKKKLQAAFETEKQS